MYALVSPFVQICLLKLRPQDLPASQFLLGLSVAAYTITVASTIAILGLAVPAAFLAGLVASVLLAAFTAALLYPLNLAARLPQTLSALAGCGAVMHAFSVPLALMMGPQAEGLGLGVLAALGFLTLMVWSFAITAHVLRHALSTSFIVGLVLAIVFTIASDHVLALLFDFHVDAG